MKDIKGYEGIYAITEDGKVWSYRRKTYLKASPSKDGMLLVVLCNNCIRKSEYIHRLMANTYLDNPEGLSMVKHIDGNKENNNINNLKWATSKEIHTGRKRKGYKIYCVELDRVFESMAAASKELKLDKSNISKYCNGKLKTCGGYHFELV